MITLQQPQVKPQAPLMTTQTIRTPTADLVKIGVLRRLKAEDLTKLTTDELSNVIELCRSEVAARTGRFRKEGLRTHQIRVLKVLCESNGPLSRVKIADRADISGTVVSRALGYEDPDRRANFEANDPCGGYPSLLTLQFAEPIELDIDGIIETAYSPTLEGRRAFEELGNVSIPRPR